MIYPTEDLLKEACSSVPSFDPQLRSTQRTYGLLKAYFSHSFVEFVVMVNVTYDNC